MLERAAAFLADGTRLIFTTPLLTEALRLALGEYGAAGQAAATLEGLDGAGSSSLAGVHETLIVIGAAGYAAQARALERAEGYQEGGESAALKAWGDARLGEFKAMLGFVFPGYLVTLAGAGGAQDAGKIAAEIALLAAQTAALEGQEARAAAAEAHRLAAEAGEAARLNELRSAARRAWGTWDRER